MIQKEVLHGGRRGKISKEEDKVIRPGNKWTSHVQSFLSFMHENGFNNIPKPYGINESGMEMVSFVDGTVYNDSLPNEILTDELSILKELLSYRLDECVSIGEEITVKELLGKLGD